MAIIDQAQLMEYVEGDLEMLEIAYEAFCEECPKTQAQLRAAFASGDLESVHSLAHSMRGMAANFMADSACQTTTKIEAIKDPAQLAASQILVDTLGLQVEQMLVELKQILAAGNRP